MSTTPPATTGKTTGTSELLGALNKNGSGLNLGELARTLVTAEVAPKASVLRNRIEGDAVKLSALSQLRGQFDKLGGVLASVAGNPVLTVTTSSPAIMPKVSDRSLLQSGTTQIEVVGLAQRQVLEFSGFASAGATVQAGRITLEFGSWDSATASAFTAAPGRQAVVLEVAEGTTLTDFAAQLSGVAGINARVLTKGDGTVSLGIVGETGAASALRLVAAAGDGSGEVALSALDTTAGNAARQVQAATDARVIVDGILISRPDNVLADVVPGMSVTLSGVTGGTLTIGRDASVAEGNLQALVQGLNEIFALLSSLTANGAGEGVAGDLAGDRGMKALAQSLRSLVAAPLVGFGDRAIHLADLGLRTQKDGSLVLDKAAFDKAFAAEAGRMDAVLGDSLRALTPGLTVSGTPGGALASGSYDFAVQADGTATLGGYRMAAAALEGGLSSHTALDGPVRGLVVRAEAGVTGGRIQFGRSFIAGLATLMDEATGSMGAITRREAGLNQSTTTATGQLEALDARTTLLEKRYLSRFAAMEQVVTRMKSTGSYLTNLVAMWSKAD